MVFIDKMHNLTDTLENEGLVRLPTHSVWCSACSMHSSKALKKIMGLKQEISQYPNTVLVNSLLMVKQYFPQLHPRLETLLYYFERPISIVYPTNKSNLPDHIKAVSKTITFRLTHDQFCQKLIDLMDEPLIVSAAITQPNSFPASFQNIDSHIIRNMNYICQHRTHDNGFRPEIIVDYDNNGELQFLRE